jgi:transcriptional regulator with XRE-family HTH domain
MSTADDETRARVGQQLARRREALDLTQGALAALVRITVTTVSSTERGRTTITRGKRSAWEAALRLRPGTIAGAYRGGPLEALDEEPQPYADMTDRHERAIWEMSLSEEDRRAVIDVLRSDRRERSRNSA